MDVQGWDCLGGQARGALGITKIVLQFHARLNRRKQSIDHYITYSVISSQPELSYSSVVSTIRVYPVTSGKHEGQTFITWTGNFSSDADASAYLHTIAQTLY